VINAPIRQRSCKGEPPPWSEFTRRCRSCGACFIGLAPGKTGERGLWGPNEMVWACSQECYDQALAGR